MAEIKPSTLKAIEKFSPQAQQEALDLLSRKASGRRIVLADKSDETKRAYGKLTETPQGSQLIQEGNKNFERYNVRQEVSAQGGQQGQQQQAQSGPIIKPGQFRSDASNFQQYSSQPNRLQQFQSRPILVQGPVKPGTSEITFRQTGQSREIVQGPVRQGTSEEIFRESGKQIIIQQKGVQQYDRPIGPERPNSSERKQDNFKQRVGDKLQTLSEDLRVKGGQARYDVERLTQKPFQSQQAEKRKNLEERRLKLEEDKKAFNMLYGDRELSQDEYEKALREGARLQREEQDIQSESEKFIEERNPLVNTLGRVTEGAFVGGSEIIQSIGNVISKTKEEKETEKREARQSEIDRKNQIKSDLQAYASGNVSVLENYKQPDLKEVGIGITALASGLDIKDPLVTTSDIIGATTGRALLGEGIGRAVTPLVIKGTTQALRIENKIIKPVVTNTVKDELIQIISPEGKLITVGKFNLNTKVTPTVLVTDSLPKKFGRIIFGEDNRIVNVVRSDQEIVTIGTVIKEESRVAIGLSGSQRRTKGGSLTKLNILEPANQVPFNPEDRFDITNSGITKGLTPAQERALITIKNQQGYLPIKSTTGQSIEYTSSALRVTPVAKGIIKRQKEFQVDASKALIDSKPIISEYLIVTKIKNVNKRYDTVGATVKIGENDSFELYETTLSLSDVTLPTKSLVKIPRSESSIITGVSKVRKEPIDLSGGSINSDESILDSLDKSVVRQSAKGKVKDLLPTVKAMENALSKQLGKQQTKSSQQAARRAISKGSLAREVRAGFISTTLVRSRIVQSNQVQPIVTENSIAPPVLETPKASQSLTSGISGIKPTQSSFSSSFVSIIPQERFTNKSVNKYSSVNKELNKEVIKELLRPREETVQKTNQKQLQRLTLKQIQKTNIKLSPSITPSTGTSRLKIKPVNLPGLGKDVVGKSKSTVEAFTPYIKVSGKVKYLGGLFERGQAYREVEKALRKDLSATGGITPTGKKIKTTATQYTPSAGFRTYRYNQGKRVGLRNEIIQRSGVKKIGDIGGSRLSTRSEINKLLKSRKK